MARGLVPELHDIGKIVDSSLVQDELRRSTGDNRASLHDSKLGTHCFSKNLTRYGLTPPSGLTWLAILYHMYGKLWNYQFGVGSPPEPLSDLSADELFGIILVLMADTLAASASRVLGKDGKDKVRKGLRGEPAYTVHRIWASETQGQQPERPLPVRNVSELQALFDDADRGWEAFRSKYRDVLSIVPEDKSYLRAVTSLDAHMLLTGKFHRVLGENISLLRRGNEIRLICGPLEAATLSEAYKCFVFRLAQCNVIFPQRPARIHDLGVFLKLQEVMQGIEKDDHVLLHTLDTLWLFLPLEPAECADKAIDLRSALQPFLDAGFVIRAKVVEAPLKELDPRLFRHRERLTNICLYPDMPPVIPPPLCDLCQSQQGSAVPDERSGITEFLCDTCQGFRDLIKNPEESKRSPFARVGGDWEERDLAVAWIRVRLDYDRLQEVLPELYGAYLIKLHEDGRAGLTDLEIAKLCGELRDTALMVDFTEDYKRLLGQFSHRLEQEFGENNAATIAKGSPELLAVALSEEGQSLSIVDTFTEEFGRLFATCEGHSPVSLSISIANAKYPFFEHWRYLNQPKEAINVQVVGRACLELSIPRYKRLREMAPERASSKLHRAAAVGARSGSALMEKIEFLENLGRYPNLHRAHIEEGFAVGQLLDYHRILEVGSQQ